MYKFAVFIKVGQVDCANTCVTTVHLCKVLSVPQWE